MRIVESPIIQSTLSSITPLDQESMKKCKCHHERLAIPLFSLGRLHQISIRLAGIQGRERPRVQELAIVTMAGDHGIVAQGVSKFPQAVTLEMLKNFLMGGAAINVFAKHVGARLTVVDMGVMGEVSHINPMPGTRFVEKKIMHGTEDITKGPAMTREQAICAIEAGINVLLEEASFGLDAVATGDMGIGNTTISSAIGCVVMGRSPEDLVNTGTGIDQRTLKNKIQVVAKAIAVNKPEAKDPIQILSKIGGLEIAGLVGIIMASCAKRIPVVIDGFISAAAALVADLFHPHIRDYLFAGHISDVKGHLLMLDHLGLEPLVDLKMRLGEGTGAALGLSLLKLASRISNEMLTFEEAGVEEPRI